VRYWWVNQNQTYRHEVSGGYLWSPKRKANGAKNAFYDFMREVAPGDIIFSFSDTRIRAIGIAAAHACEFPKPSDFDKAGAHWDNIGWRVGVQFHELAHTIRPADHMSVLAPLLPDRYAPLRANGAGLQHIYLAPLSEQLAAALITFLGTETHSIVTSSTSAEAPSRLDIDAGQTEWEEKQLAEIRQDRTLDKTEREQLVLARVGQGQFKKRVMAIERCCRITGVEAIEHLRASHCKPWRDSTNEELTRWRKRATPNPQHGPPI
jgi:hypothetical protein